jgi:hypothetical protein
MPLLWLFLPLIFALPAFAHVGNHRHLSTIEIFGHAAEMSHIGMVVIAAFLAVIGMAILRAPRIRVRATSETDQHP